MKISKSIFVWPIFAAIVLLSCEKADTKVTFLGGTAPVLTASSTSPLVLMQNQSAYSSLQFQWSNPGYTFSNGVNTQDVYYTLQIDTVGSNFTNPNMVTLPFTGNVSTSFTVKGLDDALAGLQLTDYTPHNFAFRIMATLASNGTPVEGGVPVFSNVVPITISTYLDVIFPVPANLYITGSATAKSWMAGGDAPVVSQQFTKVNPYTFVLSNFPIIGGQEFLLVPVYGDWTNKYGTVGANDTNNVSGDAFVPAGNNFLAPPTSKSYTITVNFKTGKYSIQ
jgi:starch-binding outer membrane protein SusE/F